MCCNDENTHQKIKRKEEMEGKKEMKEMKMERWKDGRMERWKRK
jgi:hypothetical protein